MRTYQGFVPAAGVWFLVLATGAIGVKAACEISKRLPERAPLVVIMPSPVTAEEASRFTGAMETAGGAARYIPKDEGLGMLREELGASGAFLDSAVMSDIPGNPLPDMFIVSASSARSYDELARVAAEVAPGAHVMYDAEVIRRMDAGLTAGRWVSSVGLAILCVLCLVSLRDRMSAAGRRSEFTVDARGAGEFLGQAIWSAAAPMLGAIAFVGGAISAAGYYAGSHTGHPMGACVGEMAAWMRVIAPDAELAGWVTGGWVVLVGIACATRTTWRSRPARLMDPSCETIVQS